MHFELNIIGSYDRKKNRARILTPPSKLTQPTRLGAANWKRVQPVKAAKLSDNAQIFTADHMRQNLRNNSLV